MKPSTWLCALALASPGLAVPIIVRTTFTDAVTHVRGHARHFIKITRVSMRIATPVIVVKAVEGSHRRVHAHDSHPMTPPERASHPVAVAGSRLLRIKLPKIVLDKSTPKPQPPHNDNVVDKAGKGAHETTEPMRLENVVPKMMASRLGCLRHVRVAKPSVSVLKQHLDVIIIGTVLFLILMVVLAETIGNMYQSLRRRLSPKGEIRLEADEKVGQQASFRGDSEPDVQYPSNPVVC